MTERIEELAQGCFEYFGGTDIVEFNYKKFAQLIAEDCAKMLDEDSYIIPELGGYAHDIRTRYGVK
jgi:hypothetical protein